MKIAITSLLLVSVLAARAQYTSQQGKFQVDQVKGCAPFTVTLTNLQAGACTSGSPCAMDYLGNGQSTQNVFTFTYTNPGNYVLKVLYQSTGEDRINITVDQNIAPPFDVYRCAGNGASVKINDNHYDQYLIDFNADGSVENTIPGSNNQVANFNFGSPGNKSIQVRGRDLNSADNCSSTVQTLTAVGTLTAGSFQSLTLVGKNKIQLVINPVTDILHRLEVAVNNASSFQLLQTVYEKDSIVVNNINTAENFYCFRLGTYDPCNGSTIYSGTICSSRLSLDIQSAVNKLSWITSTTGLQSVSIVRNNGPYLTIPGAPTSFNDVDIECKTDYCYQVVMNYPGGAKSYSAEKCGRSFTITTPTQIRNTSIALALQGAELTWVQDPPDQPSAYDVLRSQDKKSFGTIDTSNTTFYVDHSFATGNHYCYRIDYTDDCDNESPEGAIACPTELAGEIDDANVITLNWTRFVGWANGVSDYTVEKYDVESGLIKRFDVGLDTVFIDDEDDPDHQMVRYRVVAKANQSGILNSVSNSVTFTKENNIYYPTAFSPNGDKLNDQFSIKGHFLVAVELSIYNRWGQLIYRSESNEPWDGTFQGKPAQEDAYVWLASITDKAGRTFKRSGTIALLRKMK